KSPSTVQEYDLHQLRLEALILGESGEEDHSVYHPPAGASAPCCVCAVVNGLPPNYYFGAYFVATVIFSVKKLEEIVPSSHNCDELT
ncbi:hypothetical protein U9M48_022193, partial [Paspalum notatum var. saurae]